MTPTRGLVPSSFRDPSGFVFHGRDSVLYRQVNPSYREHYDHLMSSGLYERLVGEQLLVSHTEESPELALAGPPYKVLKPQVVPFISYPYEWCFSQLKDAALLTLKIQEIAFEHGMVLKDASAYNVQFLEGRPVLIDTLSFEIYKPGQPWVAYRQFCQHFLAPLALMARKDVRLNKLLTLFIDGVPIDLASRLLPARSRFSFSLLSHIHLHARSQARFADRPVNAKERKISSLGFRGIVDSLASAVRSLKWRPAGTEWADYYQKTNYSADALERKRQLVGSFIEEVKPASVWDLGANTGFFSSIAAEREIPTVAFDIDPAAVEKLYLQCRRAKSRRILPLLLDLTNPSPAIGWHNKERMSLPERGPVDLVMALALIHHLAISNNVPFRDIASFCAAVCKNLIIEFVPKEDSQVQRLLATREDVFPDYRKECFEESFSQFFSIEKAAQIEGSNRILYLLKRKNATS